MHNPKASTYYRCVEDHFEQLETVWLPACRAYSSERTNVIKAVFVFGGFQNFHPHLHVLATDGCFYNDAAFMVCPAPDTSALEKLFRYEVFKMLKAEGKINNVVIENMMNPHRPARMIT